MWILVNKFASNLYIIASFSLSTNETFECEKKVKKCKIFQKLLKIWNTDESDLSVVSNNFMFCINDEYFPSSYFHLIARHFIIILIDILFLPYQTSWLKECLQLCSRQRFKGAWEDTSKWANQSRQSTKIVVALLPTATTFTTLILLSFIFTGAPFYCTVQV